MARDDWREGKKPKTMRTNPEAIREFRQRHNLVGKDMDYLMGFFSDGRATRRWESDGAPYYMTILMAYVDRFGLDLMRELAANRDS